MLFFRKSAPIKDALREQTALLLVTPTSLADLSPADARVVVSYMMPKRLKQGTVFIHEGEVTHTDFMMIIIEGEVLVQREVSNSDDGMVMSVIGPGSMIGEMGLLDGEPRSASCTAATDLTAAVLPRDAMLKLIKTKPEVAARLMLAVSKRLSDRLREANRKIKTLDAMNRALQQELAVAHKLLGAANAGGQRKP